MPLLHASEIEKQFEIITTYIKTWLIGTNPIYMRWVFHNFRNHGRIRIVKINSLLPEP